MPGWVGWIGLWRFGPAFWRWLGLAGCAVGWLTWLADLAGWFVGWLGPAIGGWLWLPLDGWLAGWLADSGCSCSAGLLYVFCMSPPDPHGSSPDFHKSCPRSPEGSSVSFCSCLAHNTEIPTSSTEAIQSQHADRIEQLTTSYAM